MAYLFFQTWVWLLLAFILGLLLGGFFCWLCCRNNKQVTSQPIRSEPIKQPQAFVNQPSAKLKSAPVVVEKAPESVIPVVSAPDKKILFFSQAPDDIDDLKRIKGVGAVLEKVLNGLGVYQFKQIAEFSPDDIKNVDDAMSFPGRIDREDWVNQAKQLSEGKETEFSKRVDHGDVEY